MGGGNSGRVSSLGVQARPAATAAKPKTTDADYNSGGTGMFGSLVFKTRQAADNVFGVKYKNDEYWDGYDNAESKGAFKDWYDSLESHELDAVKTYTGSKYREINDYLRQKKLDSAPASIKAAVYNFDAAVAKAYLPKAITVWRGGSNKLVGGASTLAEIKALVGSKVIDRGIMSTAVTKEKMWHTSGGNIGYEIVYPKGYGRGVYADPVSKNHGEQEFTAARNTRYEVMGGYVDAKGRLICKLKAIYS